MSEDIICEPPVATTVSNGAPRVKNLTPNNHEKVYLFYSAYLLRLSASTSYAQKKVIKTMMIAGQDGSHYWRGACEVMKQILENSGMFKVDFVLPRISEEI